MEMLEAQPELKEVMDQLASDLLCPDEPGLYQPIIEALIHQGDYFLVFADFDAYQAKQREVEALFRKKKEWNRMAALNVARIGKFSSDRTIMDYATEIWDAKPYVVKG